MNKILVTYATRAGTVQVAETIGQTLGAGGATVAGRRCASMSISDSKGVPE